MPLGHLYAIGGDDNGAALSVVYVSAVDPSGNPGPWISSSPLPSPVTLPGSASDASFAYLAGGFTDSSYSNPLTTVYQMPFPAASPVGWTTGPALPAALGGVALVSTGSYVYAIGGASMAQVTSTPTIVPSTNVYVAPVNASGISGNWTSTTALPGARFAGRAFTDGSYVFLAGGHDGGSSTSTVYAAQILSGGGLGAWQTTTSMPSSRYLFGLFSQGGHVFVVGGPSSNQVHGAPIQIGGTLGTWTAQTPFPVLRWRLGAAALGSYLYVYGGRVGFNVQSTVYRASVTSPGTLSSWTAQNNAPFLIQSLGSVSR